MAKRVTLTTAKIILGIPTLKVIYDDLYCSIPTCHILKTKIVANKIYIKRLSTTTKIYSCNQYNIKKNCLIFKP